MSRENEETPFRSRQSSMADYPRDRSQSQTTISGISISCGPVPSSTRARRGLHAQTLREHHRWSWLNTRGRLWRQSSSSLPPPAIGLVQVFKCSLRRWMSKLYVPPTTGSGVWKPAFVVFGGMFLPALVSPVSAKSCEALRWSSDRSVGLSCSQQG